MPITRGAVTAETPCIGRSCARPLTYGLEGHAFPGGVTLSLDFQAGLLLGGALGFCSCSLLWRCSKGKITKTVTKTEEEIIIKTSSSMESFGTHGLSSALDIKPSAPPLRALTSLVDEINSAGGKIVFYYEGLMNMHLKLCGGAKSVKDRRQVFISLKFGLQCGFRKCGQCFRDA